MQSSLPSLGELAASVGSGPVVVGFSGGGDSTALLALLAPVARKAHRALIALIVDHGLRPESADEAVQAARAAERLGAKPQIVRLEWGSEAARGQAAARAARHRAFADAAGAHGADRIHLGHTADDQSETVLMRLRRGSGRAGLAGMAALEPSALWPEGRRLLVSRPLLRTRRALLRDFLQAEGLHWIEDPSNAASRFERVRVRAELDGQDPARLLALAHRAAAWRTRADIEARALLADAEYAADGALRIDPAFIESESAGAVRAIAVVAAACGGARREPSAAAALRLRDTLRREGAATVSGSLWRLGRSVIHVDRDKGGLTGRADGAPPLPIQPAPMGQEIVWDARLAVLARRSELRLAPAKTRAAPEILTGQKRIDLPAACAEGLVEAAWLVQMRIARSLWRALGEESLTGCV